VTSDGTGTVLFGHVKENPLVNAIELIDRHATPVTPGAATFLRHRSFGGAAAGPPSVLTASGVDWSTARGSFLSDGRIYYGTADGKMAYRSFNGTRVGTAKSVY